ncbi:PREDICTED: olfactory receptor 6-like [Nanorana parkeri]|uniref:olfactory receptor 6-like n=1 Tax=Nanorana parkeri TaxID=125878 RepID=UPI000854F3F0|nr:PREDICTED: olfactory receptor 6-like [Nanorana parkeri]
MATNESSHVTDQTHFVLLGFPTSPFIKTVLTAVFSIAYIFTLLENVTIIAIVWWDPKLHTPMYFFLSKLSYLETLYVSVTVPKMLSDLTTETNVISVWGCLLQLYLFLSIGCIECFLLAVMAYDRYLAICNPLHYHSIMTSTVCWILTGGSTFLGFLACSFSIGLIAQLDFCGSRTINHYLCDISPVIHLSCNDISTVELVNFISALFVLITSLVLITISYICIIFALKKIPSDRRWKKAFSTCASHLTVVVLFFGTTIFMYARPQAIDSFDFNKCLSVLYSFIIPMLNPLIYTFRNTNMRKSLQTMFSFGIPLCSK